MPAPNSMPQHKTPAEIRQAADVSRLIIERQERQRRARARRAGLTVLTRAELAAPAEQQDEVA